MTQSFYEQLGVSSTSTVDDIKKAYRKMANRYHPDKNPNDPTAEEKFKDVKRAYEVLSNDQERAAYDSYGHEQYVNGGHQQRRQHDPYADAFKRAFEEHRRQAEQQMQMQMRITLTQAVRGDTIDVSIPITEQCDVCDGTGSRSKQRHTCSTCNGIGATIKQVGDMRFQTTCDACNGLGTTVSDACTSCGGSGEKHNIITRQVKLPQGVDTGDRIDLVVNGKRVGLVLVVVPDKTFQRGGMDLKRTIDVDVVTAVLGGKVITTDVLGNTLTVTIPAGIQPGQALRLSGKGITRDNRHGDLYCEVKIKIPTGLSDDKKVTWELLREPDQQ